MSPQHRRGILTSLITLALTALSSEGQTTNQAWSTNVAGVIAVDVPRGGLVLASMPLEGFGQVANVSNTVGSQVPNGTAVWVWNLSNDSYSVTTRTNTWSTGDLALNRGIGFWFIATATNAWTTTSARVYLPGVMPLGTLSTTTVATVYTNDYVGYAFPHDQLITNLTLVKQAVPGSKVILWNVAAQQYYASYTRSAFGWPPSLSTMSVYAARGFIFSTTNPVAWTEVFPCNWF